MREERFRTLRVTLFSLLFLVVAALLSGCLSTAQPNPPKHWSSEVLESARGLQTDGPKLQVLVTYDPIYSTHAALRLADTGEGALFWDPAGRYGERSDGTYAPHLKRVNDLIVENEPTLEMYWASSVSASDTVMEVFEWELSQEQVRRIRSTLLKGTKTTKPFCSSAISRLLKTSGDGPVKLESTYLLPHHLAEALYRADPNRVIIFRRGQKAVVYNNRQSDVGDAS